MDFCRRYHKCYSYQEEKAKRKEQSKKDRNVRTVLTRKDKVEFFRKRALIAFHPPKDGNCQFRALCFFLRSIGIERSPGNARKRDCKILRRKSKRLTGFPLELFAGQGWADYLTEMNKDSPYGDHITLRAASDIFSVQITVHSSLGVEANTIISPFTGVGVANFYLGHFAEGKGSIMCA